MSTRVLTLFGEEVISEPAGPASSRVTKKKAEAELDIPVKEKNNLTATQIPDIFEELPPTPSIQEEEKGKKGKIHTTEIFPDLFAPVAETHIEYLVEKEAIHDPEVFSGLFAPPAETHIEDATENEPIHTPGIFQEVVEAIEETHEERITESELAHTPEIPNETEVELNTEAAPVEISATEPTTPFSVAVEELPPAKAKVATKKKPSSRTKVVKKAKNVDVSENAKTDKQYYAIGEVAKILNVKTSNVRFWTIEFAMKVRTTRKGDRLYTPEQVKEMQTIYHLVKEKKYTISGAKAKLKSKKKSKDETPGTLKDMLLRLKNELLIIRDQLI